MIVSGLKVIFQIICAYAFVTVGLAFTGSAHGLNMNEPFRFFALTAFDGACYTG